MEDYTSLVPYYTFPDDSLEAQEVALATNPLLQRLIASRESYAGDPHRPVYHYVNPEAMLNDPNGLCFWQGRWHLFYQAYPPEDTRQHWGHAISDDLVHWRDLPYCIYPNPERCCYSGAALVEEDRVIAMYHGTVVGNMVAVSSDPLLLNWEKVTGAPVIPMPPADGPARAVPGIRSVHLEEGRGVLLAFRRHQTRGSRAASRCAPTTCSAPRTWPTGPTCTPSWRTTPTPWWGTTAPVPISGPSATATSCFSSAT